MGLFEKPTAKSWTKVVCLFVIVLSLFYAHANIASWGYTALLLPVTALFATALAMTGHEGIHASACKSKAGNMTLAAIVFPLFTGLSMTYWRQKHNVDHHAKPNVHNEDPDIAQWPLFGLMLSTMRERSHASLTDISKAMHFGRYLCLLDTT